MVLTTFLLDGFNTMYTLCQEKPSVKADLWYEQLHVVSYEGSYVAIFEVDHSIVFIKFCLHLQ